MLNLQLPENIDENGGRLQQRYIPSPQSKHLLKSHIGQKIHTKQKPITHLIPRASARAKSKIPLNLSLFPSTPRTTPGPFKKISFLSLYRHSTPGRKMLTSLHFPGAKVSSAFPA